MATEIIPPGMILHAISTTRSPVNEISTPWALNKNKTLSNSKYSEISSVISLLKEINANSIDHSNDLSLVQYTKNNHGDVIIVYFEKIDTPESKISEHYRIINIKLITKESKNEQRDKGSR